MTPPASAVTEQQKQDVCRRSKSRRRVFADRRRSMRAQVRLDGPASAHSVGARHAAGVTVAVPVQCVIHTVPRQSTLAIEHDDGENDEPVLDLAERERDAAGRQQRPDQRRAELVEEQLERRRAGCFGKAVGAEALKARVRIGGREPSGPACSSATTSSAGVACQVRSLMPRTLGSGCRGFIRARPVPRSVETRNRFRGCRRWRARRPRIPSTVSSSQAIPEAGPWPRSSSA